MDLKEIEKFVEGLYGKPDGPITFLTGKGGCKESLKAHCEAFGWEWNWRNMRRMYYFLVGMKHLEAAQWVEDGKRYRSYKFC